MKAEVSITLFRYLSGELGNEGGLKKTVVLMENKPVMTWQKMISVLLNCLEIS